MKEWMNMNCECIAFAWDHSMLCMIKMLSNTCAPQGWRNSCVLCLLLRVKGSIQAREKSEICQVIYIKMIFSSMIFKN